MLNHNGDIFYINPLVLDSEVGFFLNSRFSMFNNSGIELSETEMIYDDNKKEYIFEDRMVTLKSGFWTLKQTPYNNGNIFQIFRDKGELYIRVNLEYYYQYDTARQKSYEYNTRYIGFKEKISDISYGSVIDKLNRVYDFRAYEEDMKDIEEGIDFFQVNYRTGFYREPYVGYDNIQLKDTNKDVVIMYLGKDKDYYFVSTDLKIYKDFFCLEAISNKNKKVILKSRYLDKFTPEPGDGSKRTVYLDSRSETQLFHSNIIVEKLEESDIPLESFSLQYDLERMDKIKELMQENRLEIEKRKSKFLWNFGESQTTSITPELDRHMDWLDEVHSMGFDDNDLF